MSPKKSSEQAEQSELKLTGYRLSQDELKGIEDYFYKHRFKSRNEAVRWLLTYALKRDPAPPGK
jgi:hypothetical protein